MNDIRLISSPIHAPSHEFEDTDTNIPLTKVSVSVSIMLSGRGLCVGLITRPEEFYSLWCVVVWDVETQ
jgi:hypothetical protein